MNLRSSSIFACRFSVLVLVGLCLSLGCSPAGPKLTTVKGTVTLDGQPLKVGWIIFTDTGPAFTHEGLIKDGQYSALVVPGKKKVSISTAKNANGDPTPETIPAKFNTETELTATVDDKGATPPNFDVKSN